MSLFSVKANPDVAGPKFGGVDAMVIQAQSSAEAKLLAQGAQDGDSDAVWNAATVVDMATAPVLTGWTFGIAVNTSTPTSVSVTGVLADTVDTIGTALATALAAAGHGTTNAAYNTSTNVLTVASAGNALGDKTITATLTPPAGMYPTGQVPVTIYTSKVDGGSSGTALTITLDPTWVIPGVVQKFKQ